MSVKILMTHPKIKILTNLLNFNNIGQKSKCIQHIDNNFINTNFGYILL